MREKQQQVEVKMDVLGELYSVFVMIWRKEEE